jgi:hypothetical protein
MEEQREEQPYSVTLPSRPTIWFASIASITDAVPRAMLRAYE